MKDHQLGFVPFADNFDNIGWPQWDAKRAERVNRLVAEQATRFNVSQGAKTSGAQAEYVRGLLLREAVAKKAAEPLPERLAGVSAAEKGAVLADPYAHLREAAKAGKTIVTAGGLILSFGTTSPDKWKPAFQPHEYIALEGIQS